MALSGTVLHRGVNKGETALDSTIAKPAKALQASGEPTTKALGEMFPTGMAEGVFGLAPLPGLKMTHRALEFIKRFATMSNKSKKMIASNLSQGEIDDIIGAIERAQINATAMPGNIPDPVDMKIAGDIKKFFTETPGPKFTMLGKVERKGMQEAGGAAAGGVEKTIKDLEIALMKAKPGSAKAEAIKIRISQQKEKLSIEAKKSGEELMQELRDKVEEGKDIGKKKDAAIEGDVGKVRDLDFNKVFKKAMDPKTTDVELTDLIDAAGLDEKQVRSLMKAIEARMGEGEFREGARAIMADRMHQLGGIIEELEGMKKEALKEAKRQANKKVGDVANEGADTAKDRIKSLEDNISDLEKALEAVDTGSQKSKDLTDLIRTQLKKLDDLKSAAGGAGAAAVRAKRRAISQLLDEQDRLEALPKTPEVKAKLASIKKELDDLRGSE